MDVYIIIDIDEYHYLNYWSNKDGWTYYRGLATEFNCTPTWLPIGNKVSLVKTETTLPCK